MANSVKDRFEKQMREQLIKDTEKICVYCKRSIADRINTVSPSYSSYQCRWKHCRGVEHVRVG